MTTPTPNDSTTRADPCPEIPGELRTWSGFDAFNSQIFREWPNAVPSLVSYNLMIWRYYDTPSCRIVGYVQRDRTVKDDRWRRFGVSGKIRAR